MGSEEQLRQDVHFALFRFTMIVVTIAFNSVVPGLRPSI
jgi:hypothetical protein